MPRKIHGEKVRSRQTSKTVGIKVDVMPCESIESAIKRFNRKSQRWRKRDNKLK